MTRRFGLKKRDLEKICGVLSDCPQVQKAVLYGSRAIGNYKNGSDIDLTLFGKDLTLDVLYQIDRELDDLMLPYTFDLSLFAHLNDGDLIEHIQRVGVVFWQRP